MWGYHMTPMISPIQRMVLYEAKDKLYLIGTNNAQTSFRVLHFDRTDTELMILDDKIWYSADDIHKFLKRVYSEGSCEKLSCYGLVGLVRFMDGYYMILITRRKQVAVIGHHTIYKIEETVMKYIPSKQATHADEGRYIKMFTNVDLRSNFYFSYSYDLSRTLQFQLARLHPDVEHKSVWRTIAADDETPQDYELPRPRFESDTTKYPDLQHPTGDKVLAGRIPAHEKFVWNHYLIEPLKSFVHPDWLLSITHGFVGQAKISYYGRSLFLTLIARRSRIYAGPRYQKRGANFEGYVANEVESEQILNDSSISSFEHGLFSSYVQLRGSVPAHWSQEVVKYVPKPQINLNIFDPYYMVAGLHFNQVLKRYGAPVMILDLVKKKEKKKHESLLREELDLAVNYLNQFLPEEHQLEHIAFDMARQNKKRDANVMTKLAVIAKYTLKKNGIFLTGRCNPRKDLEEIGGKTAKDGRRLQTGVTRVNCVDCLDRTNTAQFALGRCALGYQLYALGVIPEPKVEFDTDCASKLEELYENHGDIIALQYGGSQLVHRVKTYRKIAPITSQSRDIYMTLSRYYNNNFSDKEKQDAMDLFLGIYRCDPLNPISLWDLGSDYYLHNSVPAGKLPCHRRPYSMWCDEDALLSLPFAFEETHKHRLASDVCQLSSRDERVDAFQDQYRPNDVTILDEVYSLTMEETKEIDPFAMQLRGRALDDPQNPSMSAESTSSSLKNEKEDEDDRDDVDTDHDDYEDFLNQTAPTPTKPVRQAGNEPPFLFVNAFKSMKQTYGTEIGQPSSQSSLVYERYANIDKFNENFRSSFEELTADPHAVPEPVVSQESRRIYEQYINKPETMLRDDEAKLNMYRGYVNLRKFY